jgi:hypothetical protein
MNIQGENRSSSTGLELKCNQYEGTIMDKIITWDEHKITKAAGIAESQGSSSSNPEDMARIMMISELNPLITRIMLL